MIRAVVVLTVVALLLGAPRQASAEEIATHVQLIALDDLSALPLRSLCGAIHARGRELPYEAVTFIPNPGIEIDTILKRAVAHGDPAAQGAATASDVYGRAEACIESSSPSSDKPFRQVILFLKRLVGREPAAFQVGVAYIEPGKPLPPTEFEELPVASDESVALKIAWSYLDLRKLPMRPPAITFGPGGSRCAPDVAAGRSCAFPADASVSLGEEATFTLVFESQELLPAAAIRWTLAARCGPNDQRLLGESAGPRFDDPAPVVFATVKTTFVRESACALELVGRHPPNIGARRALAAAGIKDQSPEGEAVATKTNPVRVRQRPLLVNSSLRLSAASAQEFTLFEKNLVLGFSLGTSSSNALARMQSLRVLQRETILTFTRWIWMTLRRVRPSGAVEGQEEEAKRLLDELEAKVGDGLGYSLLNDRLVYSRPDLPPVEPVCTEIGDKLAAWARKAGVESTYGWRWSMACSNAVFPLRAALPTSPARFEIQRDPGPAFGSIINLAGRTTATVDAGDLQLANHISEPFRRDERYRVAAVLPDGTRTQEIDWTFANRQAQIDLDAALHYEWGASLSRSVSTASGVGVGGGVTVLNGVVHLRGIWQELVFANRPSASFRAVGELGLVCSLKRLVEWVAPTLNPAEQHCYRDGFLQNGDAYVGAGYDFARKGVPISMRFLARFPVASGALELRPAIGGTFITGSTPLFLTEFGVEAALMTFNPP